MQELSSQNLLLKISHYVKICSPVFPELRVPHSWSPPWAPFRGCGWSVAAVAHVSIHVETDGKCQSPVHNVYERDPGELNNSPEWPKSSSWILSSTKVRRGSWGWGESIMGGDQENTINKEKVVMQIGVNISPFREFLEIWSSNSSRYLEGNPLANRGFLCKWKYFLHKSNFYLVFRFSPFLLFLRK